MKLKRIIPTMILATMTIATSITAYAKPMPSNAIPTTVKIEFNNQPVQEAKGFIVDGYTYVRGRDLGDICNTEFLYDSVTKEVITRNASEMAIFDQQRMDDKLGAYQYNNENYLQIRKVMWYMLYRPEISYDNSTKVIQLTEEITLGKETTRMTQEEYMESKYGKDTNTSTSDGQQSTSTSNDTDSNTSSNTGVSVPNNDTETISNEITQQDIQDYNEELLRLVNEARAEAGVKPLTLNQELIKIATAKAVEMVELDYFSHTSPIYGEPRQFLVAIGGEKYSNKGGAENITKGATSSKINYDAKIKNGTALYDNYGRMLAISDFGSWWNSQGHKDNILNPKHTEMGASFQYSDKNREEVGVQMFIY